MFNEATIVQKSISSRSRIALILLFVAAVAFLGALVATIRPGTFYTGDGGIKFLIVEQFQRTREYSKILSDHPQWVKDIWAQGYYPFVPPFVYEENGAHVVTFPPAFQIINSVAYERFGFYGLHILPAFSVVLVWCSFLWILFVLNANRTAVAVGFFLLAFCTPLTFYGAVYWEHSLAVCLTFTAVVYFLYPGPSIALGLLTGLLSGATVWFREEAVLLPLLVVMALFLRDRGYRNRAHLCFALSMAAAVLVYCLFNYTAFGNVTGAHGYQVLRDVTVMRQLKRGLKFVYEINLLQLSNFPIVVLAIAAAWMVVRDGEGGSPILWLAAIVAAFAAGVPFVLPSNGDKQWGARFFLPLIPVVIVMLTMFADTLNRRSFGRARQGVAVVVAVLVSFSLYVNTVEAFVTLRKDYGQRVSPTLHRVKADPIEDVIVDHQFVAQALGTQFRRKNVFLVSPTKGFEELVARLQAAGRREFLLISIRPRPVAGASGWTTSFPPGILDDAQGGWQWFGSYYIGRYAPQAALDRPHRGSPTVEILGN